MKGLLTGVGIFVIALVVALLLPLFSDFNRGTVPQSVAEHFEEALLNHVLVTYGQQPIEGFDAGLLQKAFPSLREEDFEGVRTQGGVYQVSERGHLIYKRTTNRALTSADMTLTHEGYGKLLGNLLKRFEIAPKSTVAVEHLLALIGEKDIFEDLSLGYLHNDFVLRHRGVWIPYITNPSIIFSRNHYIKEPTQEELELDTYIKITSQKEKKELAPFTNVQKENLIIGEHVFSREISEEGDGGEKTLRYIYDGKDIRIILAHYPYDSESSATRDFERMVQTFVPVR